MRAKRVDSNQKTIVKELRRIPGLTVTHTHELGEGRGDIIVGFRNRNFWFEIKDPDKPPSQRKLTPAEEEFHKEWTGQIDIIETAEDIYQIIGIEFS